MYRGLEGMGWEVLLDVSISKVIGGSTCGPAHPRYAVQWAAWASWAAWAAWATWAAWAAWVAWAAWLESSCCLSTPEVPEMPTYQRRQMRPSAGDIREGHQ